jgi:hypothetical protein
MAHAYLLADRADVVGMGGSLCHVAAAEFIAQDSMLPFGSLNHTQDHGINCQTA